MATPRLGRLAADFIGYVLLFRDAPPDQRPAVPALRSHLLGLLESFSSHPDAQAVPADELELARFALVAWTDETIQITDWSGREEWLREPLQLQLFRTNRAGDEFYDHLAALRPEQNHAREVFFLCLVLGFEGRYAGQESERAELIRQQFEMLRAAGWARDIATTTPVAPPAYRVEIELRGGGGRPFWPVVLGWGLAVGATFAVLWTALRLLAGRVPLPPGL